MTAEIFLITLLVMFFIFAGAYRLLRTTDDTATDYCGHASGRAEVLQIDRLGLRNGEVLTVTEKSSEVRPDNIIESSGDGKSDNPVSD